MAIFNIKPLVETHFGHLITVQEAYIEVSDTVYVDEEFAKSDMIGGSVVYTYNGVQFTSSGSLTVNLTKTYMQVTSSATLESFIYDEEYIGLIDSVVSQPFLNIWVEAGTYRMDIANPEDPVNILTFTDTGIPDTSPLLIGTLLEPGIDLDPESVDVVVLPDGKVLTTLAVDPTIDGVTISGNPLPTGSIIRNSTNTQKFIKLAGDSKTFDAIEIIPKTEWKFTTIGSTAWNYLQNK